MARTKDQNEDPIVAAIRRTPSLRRADNEALARIVATGGVAGQRARDQMVTGNMRLVLILARKYPDGNQTLHDRIQEGSMGLMRAINKFDPDRGISFATYAGYWIRASIERAMYSNEYTISVPGNVASAMRRLRRVKASTPEPLTDDETEEVLHLSPTIARAILAVPTLHVPFDAPAHAEGDITVAEIIPDTDIEEHEDRVSRMDLWTALDECHDISERDRTMLGLFAFGETYQDIGVAYGLSRERARQIVVKALASLKRRLLNWR